MRCRSAFVPPLVFAALIIAVALVLAALDTDNSLNSIAFLGLAGAYVALYPGRGCCVGRRAEPEGG